jgi:hypothetical protein
MEARISRHEAFALTRARDTFADWFASAPRVSVDSLLGTDEIEVQHVLEMEEEMIVVRADGEGRPVPMGMISGAIGGASMLGLASLLTKSDLPTTVGSMISRGHLAGTAAFATAFAFAMVVGSILGAGFGHLTRRLRNLPALMCFGMLLSGAGWMCFHTLFLRHFAPNAMHALPVVPMILGAMAFGLVTAWQLPLRTRRI